MALMPVVRWSNKNAPSPRKVPQRYRSQSYALANL
jgi:hypothetical protein